MSDLQIGQGRPRVMVYTNFVDLHSLMFHAMFQNHRPSGSEVEDFKCVLFLAMVVILVM